MTETTGLARALAKQVRHEEAAALDEQKLPMAAQALADGNPRLSVYRMHYAMSLLELDRFEEAEALVLGATQA